jgi:putative heme iron utilization protein
MHDFDFWRLEPVRARYIGGFGAIHWLEQILLANPFAGEAEQGMVEHMNADHAAAIAHYVQLAGLPAHAPAVLVGVDSEGFHLRIGLALHWLAFPALCETAGSVRKVLVELAHAHQWPAGKTTSGE